MTKFKLIKNSGIYSVISLLQKGINFLLIPVLTLYLSPHDYGIVAVVLAINSFLNVFYLLGLNSSLNRFYYEYKGNDTILKKLYGTVITTVLLNSLFVTLILILGRKWFLMTFLDDVSFYPFMILGLISVILNPCFSIYQNILQASQHGEKFGKNNLSFFVLNLILLLVAVVVFKLKAIGVLGSLALTNIVFFVYTLIQFKNNLTFGINWRLLKMTLKYSTPLIPHTLSGVATNMIDRILINRLMTTSMVGVYSVGNNFGNIVFLIASGVNQAFAPWFNENVKDNNLSQIPKAARGLILSYCIIALGIAFFGKEIIYLITPETFHKSWVVIPLISFAFVFHGAYYFFSGPLFYDLSGRGNRIIPIVTVTMAILNITLNFIMIPIYGILGAAMATLISKIFLATVLSLIYKKFLKINYSATYLLFVPLLFLVISLITYIPFETFKYMFITKLVVYSIFILISYKNYHKEISQLLKKI